MSLSTELPGTWRLESRIDVTKDGGRRPEPLLGEDPIAIVFFDRNGNFAAQFMKRDRSALAMPAAPAAGGAAGTGVATGAAPRNNTQAQAGYDAYFGTYSVDEATGVTTHKIVASLSPASVGLVLQRSMEVQGDTLRIQLETTAVDGTPVVRTLTWKRVGEAS